MTRIKAKDLKVGDIIGLFYKKDDTSIWNPDVVVNICEYKDEGRWHVSTFELDGKFHTGGIGDNGNGLESFNDEICYYKVIGHTDLIGKFVETINHDNAWKLEVA